MMFSKKIILFSLLALSAIIVVLSPWLYHAFKPVKAESAVVKRGSIAEKLVLSGTVEAEEHAELSFQTSGLLAWVGVKEGDQVKKYQAIASLDQRELKKKLEKELNDYLKYRWDFEQKKEDYPFGVTTPELWRLVEKAQFDLNTSVLDVEIQDLAIKLSTITTPIAGVVTNVETPYPGVNVALNKTLFEIVNPDTFYIEVTADQTEVVKLFKGQKATIVLDPYPEETLGGEITNISLIPKEDETGTVYKVKVESPKLKSSSHSYRVGMTGDVNFVTSQKENVLYIPVPFLKSDENGNYLLKGEKREKTYVETGLEEDEVIEVSGAVKEGDIIYEE